MAHASGKKPGMTRREFAKAAGRLSAGFAAGWTLHSAAGLARPWAADNPSLHGWLRVEKDRQLGTIDPNVYGNFIEHLGRCIYGGVYEEGSPLSDANGFRKDVMEATRKLHVKQLRWPGGNFGSGYHWQDGIGPKDQRPARYNLAWFEPESNRFGTDEFIAYCRLLHTEPYICVNIGSGTLDEANNWLEYCNREGGTYYSDLRKKNGHAEPYHVKYWGVGNEVYGDWQIGHLNATDYAKKGLEFAKVLKWQDPSIKLVACGSGNPDWDRTVLESMGPWVDYLSEHHYTVIEDLKDYYEIMGSTAQLDQLLRTSSQVAEDVSARLGKPAPIAIALDEWNIISSWADGPKRDEMHKFEYNQNLRDALWVGLALNLIQRHCRTVRMANLAQLVNVLAPMYASPQGLLLKTIYYPLELYANRAGNVVLEVANDSSRFETQRFGAQPYLDVSATWSEDDRTLRLSVVNRHQDSDVNAGIELAGFRAQPGGRGFVINGPSVEAQNTFENPHVVTTQEVKFSASGTSFDYRFPAHSITWLEMATQ
jgi:alpha-L-arabinofuranosidase